MGDWYVVSGYMCTYHAYLPKQLYKTNVMVFADNEDDAKKKSTMMQCGFAFKPSCAKLADKTGKYMVSDCIFL